MAQNLFEIPQQLRDITEKNVEQARAAYDQFMDAMMQAVSIWSRTMPASEMTSGFKAVHELATKFAKQNAEAGFTLAIELGKASNIGEVLALQSRYSQAQLQACAFQAQELAKLVTKTAQSTY